MLPGFCHLSNFLHTLYHTPDLSDGLLASYMRAEGIAHILMVVPTVGRGLAIVGYIEWNVKSPTLKTHKIYLPRENN